MKLNVDKKQRLAKMRAHSAAHLLNAELDNILKWTKQAWSYVDEDYFRFDFTTNSPLSDQQIKTIEQNINSIIHNAFDIEKKEMSFDEAIKLWAKAFFEDKYGDKVRVIMIKNWELKVENWKFISIELCWWTHANNTADLWAFKIISQEAVASWIRRITAVTWPKVAEYAIEKDEFIKSIWDKISSTEKQIPEKLDKINKELNEIKSAYEALQSQQIWVDIQELLKNVKSNKDFEIVINISTEKTLEWVWFKEITTKAKEIIWDKSFVIFNNDWNFAISWTNAKEFAKNNWIKWWWSDNFVQWRDSKVTELFN